jgi:hypothetical protein
MATDSFTSTATGVSSTTAILTTNTTQGSKVYSLKGFECRITPSGVTVTKAASLGGTQVALTFPLSRYDAQELALLLLQVSN